MSKTAYTNVEAVATPVHGTSQINVPVDSDSWDDSKPRVLLEVEGLELFSYNEVTGKMVFQLKGIKQKERNWAGAMKALGYASPQEQDELADKLSAILFQHDIVKVLADRVKAA